MKTIGKILFVLFLITWLYFSFNIPAYSHDEGLNISGGTIKYIKDGEVVFTQGIDFPTNPDDFAAHLNPFTGVVWEWNGNKWKKNKKILYQEVIE